MKNNDKASFKDIIITISDYKNELKKQLLLIISIAIIFSLLGFGFSKLQENKYKAVLSFIVDDQSDSPNLSSMSGMANIVGFDIGGSSSSSFSPQNIIERLKTRDIIAKTLNKKDTIDGKLDLLLNHYIRINSLECNEVSDSSSKYYNDSITNVVWLRIIDRDMEVLLQNNEANIINLSFESLNAEFAKIFTEIVIDEMSEMYIDDRTEKSRNTLNDLENRSAAIKSELTLAEDKLTKKQDENNKPKSRYNFDRSGILEEGRLLREVKILNATYLESRKNIELATMNLLTETPLIQIVDNPVLPLENINRHWLFWVLIFSFLGVFTVIFIIILRKLVRDALKEEV